MSGFQELADASVDPQVERAWRCARGLAGERATRGLMRAMLELVRSVEKDIPDDGEPPPPLPPPDARKVLVPKRKPHKAAQNPPKAVQEALW